jgi:predicted ArsR family transcriptional regulator
LSIPAWLQRSLGSTRTAILTELQREPRTVEQLARMLAIAPSAVRTHLALLERDGILERLTVHRASPGKPAHAYRIAESAGVFLSSAYAPTALHLLEALQERLPPHEVAGMLRSAGRRLALRHRTSSTRLRARIADAASALTELGGSAQIAEQPGAFVLTSEGCPLAGMTGDHLAACGILEAFVSEIVAAPVRHRCAHGDRARCIFEIARESAAPDASGHSGE